MNTMDNNYIKLNSYQIKNNKIEDLLNIDIDKIRDEHLTNLQKYDNNDKIITEAQILYYFIFNIVSIYNLEFLTHEILVNILDNYLRDNNIISQYDINKLCRKFFEKYSNSNGIIYTTELKKIYKDAILGNKYKIDKIMNLTDLISIIGFIKHNYIIDNNNSICYNIKRFMSKIYKYYIVNQIYIVWIFIYIITNMALFLWKFYKFRNNEVAFNLYGYGPAFAKGFAQICLFNTFLLLLPLIFSLIRFFKKFDELANYIPFNTNILAHKIYGYAIIISGSLHGIIHINTFFKKIQPMDYITWINTDLYKKGALNDGRTFSNYTKTLPGWTGIALCILFIITIPPAAYKIIKKRNYNLFLYSHYVLFPLYFILIVIHGANQWFEPTTAWIWSIFPLTAYCIEKIYKYQSKFKNSKFKLIESIVLGKFIILKLKKNNVFNNYNPSMYVFINIPVISNIEWHPFTIVSSPLSDYITLYIENLGDWTNDLYNIVSNNQPIDNIYIDGPVNSPSENYSKYDISLMICGGIGVTPFISILKYIATGVYNYNKLNSLNIRNLSDKKVYFYWCCRNQELFNIFSKSLNDITKLNKYSTIEMNIYLTSIKQNIHKDILSNIQYISYLLTKVDIFSNLIGKKNLIKLERPNFDNIFLNMVDKYSNITIGVFFCGGAMFRKDIQKKCKIYSINNKNVKFKLYYENF